MSRIKSCLDALKNAQKKALIPYIVCGDPNLAETLDIMHALVEAGADIIELGVPFSDPMAEGPVIQLAHERALLNQVSLQDTFDCVRRFREKNCTTPIVLMGYANPIEKIGYETFAVNAQAAGVDGVLTVDLPCEEAMECNHFLQQHAIDNIFLLTPTTSEVRARNICQLARGYLYYVSLKGTTGAGHLNISDVQLNYQRLSAYTALPICVGFGIKDAASAKNIAQFSDGVIIGSALIHELCEARQLQPQLSSASVARDWLRKIRLAINEN